MLQAGVLPEVLEEWRALARGAYERLPEATRALGVQVLAEGHLEEPVKLLDSGNVEARVHSPHRGSAGYIVHGSLRRQLTCNCTRQTRCEHIASVLLRLSSAGVAGDDLRGARVVQGPPEPRLVLLNEHPEDGSPTRQVARLEYVYGGVPLVGRSSPPHRQLVEREHERVSVLRDPAAEERAHTAVYQAGFSQLEAGEDGRWLLGDELAWAQFLLNGAAALEARGVEVVQDASFSLSLIEPDEYFTELEPTDNRFFDLDFGVEVAGERMSLLPLLLEALRGDKELSDHGSMVVLLPSGRFTQVPHARVKPLLDVLIELASGEPKAKHKVTRWQAMELAETLGLVSQTGRALRELRGTLTTLTALARPALPGEFLAKLRDYQWDGLAWLRLLAGHGIGAVLADDMGLGKTVQLLAHISVRKQLGEARGPSLVVAPTSVLVAWSEQLTEFAPSLKALVWHGAERHESEGEVTSQDIVLTSYALLQRDEALLTAIDWDLAILDEAQAIKNPKTATATVARKLKAQQRIAVTGTPIENHLGELWSQLHFTVPGALGSQRGFTAAFRNPIEKHGNGGRMEALRRRVAPLLLRRTKQDVAADLPAKTLITHHIDLGEGQRDLYEAVRKLVDGQVREEIARRGIALSRIIVLDALLKLRQVCCDPHLVKTARRWDAPSAKRSFFNELLETLLAEGRSVLVFSQFVEMLDLLESDLVAAGVAHSRLTGSTRDRERQIQRFQSGEVPVFLISLKAGGVGLNLTAADTVIHYDPWWNPAAEAQATDRAHRIGQDKPVFVHRLIARGTVEEKIVGLQVRKAELAEALLNGSTRALDLDEALIDDLLSPLEP
ncbi:MAG: DEAD/DEAH box helicase [Polyangiaceae bacterium]